MKLLLRVAVAALMVLPLAVLSSAPYSPRGADAAVLRLSLRMAIASHEDCRTRTQQELDALPVHMRSPEECTRDAASYEVIARIGPLPPDTIRLARGGARGDRPIFLLNERTLPPGQHRVRVDVQRRNGSHATENILAGLDTTLTLERGVVQLVTLDRGGRLVTRTSH
jgi:hypothetical protein